MKELRRLKPAHRSAIRAIVVGVPVKDAADMIGISATFMSTIYRSREGQAFALYLERGADDYVARMMALGLVPKVIRDAVGKGPARRPFPKDVHAGEWD